MKNLLILFLTVALAAAAFFTRPTEGEFKEYVKANAPKDDRSLGEKVFTPSPTEELLRDYRFRDCYLWVAVQRDGKTVYLGAFDHYFDVSKWSKNEVYPPQPTEPAPATARR
jgi:hypothetical protein